MGAIYRREMGAFFTSGLAYVFLSVYFLISGFFFYAGSIAYGTTSMSSMFSSMFLIVMILIPIRLWSIVMGKYLAALTMFVLAESIVFVYALILSIYGTVAWASLLANYLALLILGAAFIAVGLFISSLTENQMASAVASFLALMILYFFDNIVGLIPDNGNAVITTVKDWLSHLSFFTRYTEFNMGLFNLSSIVFYLSAVFLFNFFTVRILEKRRWS